MKTNGKTWTRETTANDGRCGRLWRPLSESVSHSLYRVCCRHGVQLQMTLRCWRRTAASCSVRSRSDAGSSGDDVMLDTWYGGVQWRRRRLPARCSSCPSTVVGRCRFIACSRSRTVVVLMTSFPPHVTACDAAHCALDVLASVTSPGFVLKDVIAWCVCALPSNSRWSVSDFVLPDKSANIHCDPKKVAP